MSTGEKEHRLPPYVSYKTWNTFLEKLKGQLPLPTRMDSSVWSRLPFSGSNQSALKGTLLYMGLLDSEDHPDSRLEQLARAEDAERQGLLKEILTHAYKELLDQVELTRASPGQIREYFKSIGAEGQVGQKCASFFLSLAKEAGEKLHPSLQAKVVSARERRVTKRSKSKMPSEEQGRKPNFPPKASDFQITSHIDSSMIGLLQKLPRPSSPWSQEERQGWKKAFDALFEFLYPEKKE